MAERRFTREEALMAKALLTETFAMSEAAETFGADSFVLLTFDTETGRLDLYGPYDSPVDAMADGEFHNDDINKFEPDPTKRYPIEFTVMPLRGRIR